MNRYSKTLSKILLSALPLLALGCVEDNIPEGVDLRYEELGKQTVEDLYTVPADGTVTLSFRVKSDHPWFFTGTSQDWYTITPDHGDAGNEPVTVTVKCEPNVKLDDRSDEISIGSDYWTGKTFVLLQKGIAHMSVAEEGPLTKTKEEGELSFTVKANQRWTAEVTEGGTWLEITENPSGGADYDESETKVKLAFKANRGEAREGIVTLYDRNRDEETKIQLLCNQKGITLIPSVPADGYYKQTDYQAHSFEIPVESNGEWSVSKGDETAGWYSFGAETSFSGNGTITVNLTQNDLDAVRVGSIVLKTKKAEGAEVVTKTVTFKQANLPRPQRTVMNAGGIGSWSGAENLTIGDNYTTFKGGDVISKGGFKPGVFTLHIKELLGVASAPYLFLEYIAAGGTLPQHEIRIKFNDGNRPYWTFVTPWGYAAPSVNEFAKTKLGATVNKDEEHTLQLKLEQYGEEDAIKIWYIFDGVPVHTFVTNGDTGLKSEVNGIQGGNAAYKQPYNSTMTVKIGEANAAGTVIDYFEYTPNVDWGD